MTTPFKARTRFALLVCVMIALGTVPAHAARKAAGCTKGRFAVTQGSEMLGGSTMLTLHGRALDIEGACPATGKVGKTGRRGTAVSARWNRCGAIERVRLRAVAARDCSGIRGKVRARGEKRITFAAVPSTCGDGIADPGGGEECDGGQGCAEGEICSASCTCERAPEPMDCVVEGYPCTWGEVAPEVAAQSVALAEEANAILGGGGSVADAINAIETGGAVAVESQDATIRFRLPAGRPVWVGMNGPRTSTPAAGESVAVQASIASAGAARLHPRSVVDTGRFPKAALALAPFAWDEDYSAGAPAVAGFVDSIDDYSGNVQSMGNTSVGDMEVNLQTFASLDGYNVLYVRSGSTQACGPPGPQGPRCFTALGVAAIPGDAPWTRFDGAAPGVDLAIDDDGLWFLLVSADFFRHNYPHGLNDVLVILDAGNTAASDLARSLTGANANVAGWTGFVTAAGTESVIMPFLKGLADGRSTSDVYADMGQNIQDVALDPPADFVIGHSDIRIRDLVDVTDPSSLEPVTSNTLLTIDGYTDDGVPDHLSLLLDFLGASPDDAEGYTVQVAIDGNVYVDEPLDGFATHVGDRWWNRQLDLDLGFDVHELQPLDILVMLSLPEGGASIYHVVPLAKGSPGEKWTGHFTKTFSNGSFQIAIAVDATFERDVTQDPVTQHPEFLLTGGTMKWTLTDLEGDNCVHTAPTTLTNLEPDGGSYLKFDLTVQPPIYYGFARTEGPQVELVRSCPGSDPVTSHTQAGGVWFQAPSDVNYVASGSTLTDVYISGAALPSIHEWTISKVE